MENKTNENNFAMLIKFGSEENLLKLQKGQLYMKNLKYYVNLEKSTSDENIGDMYDGQMVVEDVNLSLFEENTGNFFTQIYAPSISINLGYLDCPVFCMFTLDHRNCTREEIENDKLKMRFDFTDEQREKFRNFGEYALIILDNEKFFKRIKKALLSEEIGFTKDYVSYYDGNLVEHAREVKENSLRIAFWKRKKYEYQQEYRLLAHTTADDFLSVDIGDITSITKLVKSEDLLNTFMEATFNIANKKK